MQPVHIKICRPLPQDSTLYWVLKNPCANLRCPEPDFATALTSEVLDNYEKAIVNSSYVCVYPCCNNQSMLYHLNRASNLAPNS